MSVSVQLPTHSGGSYLHNSSSSLATAPTPPPLLSHAAPRSPREIPSGSPQLKTSSLPPSDPFSSGPSPPPPPLDPNSPALLSLTPQPPPTNTFPPSSSSPSLISPPSPSKATSSLPNLPPSDSRIERPRQGSTEGTPTTEKTRQKSVILAGFHDRPTGVLSVAPRTSLFGSLTTHLNNPLPPVPTSSAPILVPPPLLSQIRAKELSSTSSAPSTPQKDSPQKDSPTNHSRTEVPLWSPPPPFSPPQPPPQTDSEAERVEALDSGDVRRPPRHKRQGSGISDKKFIPGPSFVTGFASNSQHLPFQTNTAAPLFSSQPPKASSRRSSQDLQAPSDDPPPPSSSLSSPLPSRYLHHQPTNSPFSPIAPVYPSIMDSVPPSPIPLSYTTSPSISQVEGSPILHLGDPIPFPKSEMEEEAPSALFQSTSMTTTTTTSTEMKTRLGTDVKNTSNPNTKRAVVRVHLPASKVIDKTLGFVTLLCYEKTLVKEFLKSILEKLVTWEENPSSNGKSSNSVQDYMLIKHSASPIALRNDDTVFSFFGKELESMPDEPLSLLLRPNVTRKSIGNDSKHLSSKAKSEPPIKRAGSDGKVLIRVEVPAEDLQEQSIDAVTLMADPATTCARFKEQILEKLHTVRKPGIKPKPPTEYVLYSLKTPLKDEAKILENIPPEHVGPGKILHLTLFTLREHDEVQKKLKEQLRTKSQQKPFVVDGLIDTIVIDKLPVTVYLPIQELHEVSADRVTILCLGETTVSDFQDKVLEKIKSLRHAGAGDRKDRKVPDYYLAKTTDLEPLHPDTPVFQNFGFKELMTGKLEARLISNATDPLKGKVLNVEVPSYGKKGQTKAEGLMFIKFAISMDSYTTVDDAKREVIRKALQSGHILRKNNKKEDGKRPSDEEQFDEELRSFDLSAEKSSQAVLDPTLNISRAFPISLNSVITLYLVFKSGAK